MIIWRNYPGGYNNNTIIIITLFQEDNIFGRVASLTYGPQLTNVGHDIIKMLLSI